MNAREIQRRVLQYLFDQEANTDEEVVESSLDIAETLGLGTRQIHTSLELLEKEGHVILSDASGYSATEYLVRLTALGRTIVQEPDYETTNLRAAIAKVLPTPLQQTASLVADPLNAIFTAVQALQSNSDLASRDAVTAAFRALAGQSIQSENTGIVVRESDETTIDVSGQVAGRDLFHITINMSSDTVGRSASVRAAFGDITERQRDLVVTLVEAMETGQWMEEFGAPSHANDPYATIWLMPIERSATPMTFHEWSPSTITVLTKLGYITHHEKEAWALLPKAYQQYKLWKVQQENA